jgi:hypothetical protein
MAPNFARHIELLEGPSELQTTTLLETEKEDSLTSPPRQNHKEQFGLVPVHIPLPAFLSTLPAAHNTDIIAVHGIGGDLHRSWQHGNEFNWIHHIHEEFPGVRVYTYGYDSGMGFSWGTSGLTNYARHLLSLIKLTRSNTDVRCQCTSLK